MQQIYISEKVKTWEKQYVLVLHTHFPSTLLGFWPVIVINLYIFFSSPDFAHNFYIYPRVLNVTMLEISLAGTILALTEDGSVSIDSTGPVQFA